MSRYSRQELFAGIGADGQKRIRGSRVALVGCGALGSVLAETMTRAGVARLAIIDRDFVEESNLQRQVLFDEADARDAVPKAVAAVRKLAAINSDVELVPHVADLSPVDAPTLLAEADLILDGTDNFETRFLVNDIAVREKVPWIYGACVAAYGLALAIRPGETPCLRCVLGEPPAPGSGPTCDTAGVVAPIVHVIAGIQAGEALKLLAGREADLLPGIVSVDLWAGSFDVMDLKGRRPSCPACTEGIFEFADRASSSLSAVLCGRDAVQVRPAQRSKLSLDDLEARLAAVGEVRRNDYLVRFRSDDAELVVFEDGRALIKGVATEARARSIYAKYIGG